MFKPIELLRISISYGVMSLLLENLKGFFPIRHPI
jgi:hypothetical protein